MRPGWPALVLSTIAWLASATAAGAADFDPRSRGWNGLSYLLATAVEARVDVELRDELNFSDLDPKVILFLVAPHAGPGEHLPSLQRYLTAGGRLVVADDFRSGFRWLRPFGVQLRARPGPAAEHVADLRHLPRFDLRALGPYLDFYDRDSGAAPQVVLNHPASLSIDERLPGGARGAIRGWFSDRARGWLAEVDGPHRVLALADSSALINAMLRGFYGNKQLAANLLRYFCYVGEPCKVRMIANLSTIQGSFDASRWGPATGPKQRDLRGRLRHYADRLSELLRKDELALLWWALLLLGMAVPVVSGARVIEPVLPPRTALRRGRTRLHETVAAWLAVRDADYRQPARLLAGHLATLVHQAAGAVDRGDSESFLHGLEGAIGQLVGSGRLSAQAAGRIADIVTALQAVAGAREAEVDRQRFTALAAEVEWAETVLSHTQATRDGPGLQAASAA